MNVGIFLRYGSDAVFRGQNAAHLIWEFFKQLDDFVPDAGEHVAHAAERERKQPEKRDLADERLGGSHADFRSGVHIMSRRAESAGGSLSMPKVVLCGRGGAGGQYFTGGFDGTRFVRVDAPAPPGWLDYGPDFYPGVTWSGGPPGCDRRLLPRWMGKWEYATDVPTQPWRSAMSVPRGLTLRRNGGVLQPVRELSALAAAAGTFSGGQTRRPYPRPEARGPDKFSRVLPSAHHRAPAPY